MIINGTSIDRIVKLKNVLRMNIYWFEDMSHEKNYVWNTINMCVYICIYLKIHTPTFHFVIGYCWVIGLCLIVIPWFYFCTLKTFLHRLYICISFVMREKQQFYKTLSGNFSLFFKPSLSCYLSRLFFLFLSSVET